MLKNWINTDPFIDVERLKSLNLDIIKGICLSLPYHERSTTYGIKTIGRPNHYSEAKKISSLTDDDPIKQAMNFVKESLNDNREQQFEALKMFTKLTQGVYSGGPHIYLRRDLAYITKNQADGCVDTSIRKHFGSLIEFANTLPFTEIGRFLLFINDHDLKTPIHTDGVRKSHKNEFLWMRTNFDKSFFLYDSETDEKNYITSHSAFFNEQDYHGTDPSSKMTFSIRIDGFFTDEFRRQLGIDKMQDFNV